MHHSTNSKQFVIEIERTGFMLVEGQQIIDQHAESLRVAAPILEQAPIVFSQPIGGTALEHTQSRLNRGEWHS